MLSKSLPPKHPKTHEGEQSVEQQQLVAEMIGKEMLTEKIEGIARQRCCQAHIGHQAVAHLPTGEESEGKESQQRAIGVAHNGVDGIDERRGVDHPDQQDAGHEEYAHGYMYPTPQTFVGRSAADIDAVAGSECRQSRVGRREGCRYDAQREEDKDERRP